MAACQSCKHFSALSNECRAHAPTAQLVPGPEGRLQVIGVWPATRKEHWCGEFEPSLVGLGAMGTSGETLLGH